MPGRNIYEAVATQSDKSPIPVPTDAWWDVLDSSRKLWQLPEAGRFAVNAAAALGIIISNHDDLNTLKMHFSEAAQPPLDLHEALRFAEGAQEAVIALDDARKALGDRL